jgi:hypothetical protein
LQRGKNTFAAQCSACHGPLGRGDGEAAKVMSGDVNTDALNLTSHARDHTMGDMFWWVSRGRANRMPAFETLLSVEERWGVVHFAHLIALGNEARVLPAPPVAATPWLPAIDGLIRQPDGTQMPLVRADGGTAAVLVFVRRTEGWAAVQALTSEPAAYAQAGAQLVLAAAQIPAALAVTPRLTEPDAAWSVWRFYRQNLEATDATDADEPSAIVFIIDRFGFVRSRWRSDEAGPAPSLKAITGVLDRIRTEPKTRDWRDHGS